MHFLNLKAIAPMIFLAMPIFAADKTTALPQTQTAQNDSGKIELTSITRANGTLMVQFKYANTTEKRIAVSEIAGVAAPATRVYLLDNVNRKRYLVIHDERGRAICSEGRLLLAAGAESACWSRFAAPPPDVKTVSVVIPGAVPFENVPISD